MSWVVVKFTYDDNSSEVEAVPSKWIVNENQCMWPSNKRGLLLKKAIKTCDPPSEDWTQYHVKVLSNEINKFDVASAKANRAQFSSDLDEECYDNSIINSKRVIKRNIRYISSSEEESGINDGKSSSGEDCSQLELPRPPTSKRNGNTVNGPTQDKRKDDSSQRSAADVLKDTRVESTTCKRFPADDEVTHKFGNILDTLLKQNIKLGNMVIQQNNVLDEMNTTLNTLVDKVNNLNVHSHEEVAVNNSDAENVEKKLPVSSDEILTEIDQILQQETKIFEAVAKKLSSVGGANYKECVRRIAPRVLTDTMAQSYSWVGHKGKRCFSKTSVANLILKSVKMGVKNETCSEKEIEKYLALWLTKAPERLKRSEPVIPVENENHQTRTTPGVV